MYDWLGDALRDAGQVLAASRRLARDARAAWGRGRLAAGKRAWQTPAVIAWQDWVGELLAAQDGQMPLRLGTHQERILWERCLRREVAQPLANFGLLVQQSREAWRRLRGFDVPLAACREAARSRDQHAFAAAATAFRSILDREGWVDDASLTPMLARLAEDGRVAFPPRLTVFGFDRIQPAAERLLRAASEAGTEFRVAPEPSRRADTTLVAADNLEGELRMAGAWAREALEEDPARRIGVVVTRLERDPLQCARLVRDSLLPGWQLGGSRHREILNVSRGQRLNDYPACAIALLWLRWLVSSLTSSEVSLLLRSELLGAGDGDDRSRLDLRLQRIPARDWTPQRFLREFPARTDYPCDWLSRVEQLVRMREALPRRETPRDWADRFDQALETAGWPGPAPLDSPDFQLINRWRELLNEFARLELVSDRLSAAEAIARLQTISADVVFQAESDQALVQVLGPAEAAGMEFDALWIAGLSAADWPPARHPLPLLARQLQRDFGMPDADPGDVLEAARRDVARLLAAAPEVRCSYSLTDGDAEQIPTALVESASVAAGEEAGDPGWEAARWVTRVSTAVADGDPVPALRPGERISGGAATLQRQIDEPFAAFVHGRLGARPLTAIDHGLSPAFRGQLLHDALFELYRDCPTREAIAAWSAEEIAARSAAAAGRSTGRHRGAADDVLLALLDLECRRLERLLAAVIRLDREREPFGIVAVERSIEAVIEGAPLRLRVDRIDRHPRAGLAIIDYKTGARRRFLGRDGEPGDFQLVVYACAMDDPVDDLAYVNVDSRGVETEGAGLHLTPRLDWAESLPGWQARVRAAARDVCRGDVRLVDQHNVQSARPLALLSRVAELRHDG